MKLISRRQLLLGSGAALALAPLFGRRRFAKPALAANESGAQRIIFFFSPNGTIPNRWNPSGGETDFVFPEGSILEPLQDLRSDLVVLRGLHFFGANNHEGGMSTMLTGGGGSGTESSGFSVDQFIASRLPQATRFSSLEFGVQTSAWGGTHQTRMSYRGTGVYAPPNDNPYSIYQRLYGSGMGSPQEVEARLRRRQSVLDLLTTELNTIGSQIGSEEKTKLEAHAEALREVERGLTSGNGCSTPDAPAFVNPYENDLFPVIGDRQMDLLVASLACDMTRVASIQWSHTIGPTVFSWLGLSDGHHSLSHMSDSNTQGVNNFVKAERWFAEQFASFIEKLKSTPDPVHEGSLFDSSLIVWCKEMGDSRLHVCRNVPFVLSGGAAGHLNAGRYLQYDGASHTQLLVSLCHKMGLNNGTFGNPSYGTGPLANL